MCVKFATESNKNCYPFEAYTIIVPNGKITRIWGDKLTKIIHKKVKELDNWKKGILLIKGFYIWKKEKAFAPIGFGDHKELLQLKELFVRQVKNANISVPVVYDDKQFFIVVDEATPKIVPYQPNEPLVIENDQKWLKSDVDKSELVRFSEPEIEIKGTE